MKRSSAYKYSLLKVGEIKNEGIFRVRLPAYIMNCLLLSFKMHLVIQTKYQIFWMNTLYCRASSPFLEEFFYEHGDEEYPVLLLCHTILAKKYS